MLEHPAVYTAGKRTSPQDRPIGDAGAPVIDVDRGGKITWHGPGQLVAYPIIALDEPVDVVAYVRATEEVMIRVCADFGVEAVRVEGRSGAWVPGTGGRQDRKVGAVGLRVARGVTMHGIAINCDCDLSWYGRVRACGSATPASPRWPRRPAATSASPRPWRSPSGTWPTCSGTAASAASTASPG